MTILGMTIYELLEYFLLYSFLGWCVEVAYQAIHIHRIINRGFLNGPVCPVYGFGVVTVFGAIWKAQQVIALENGDLPLPVLFLLGMLLTTLVELIGGFTLDKFFHARWWDYSNQRLNLNGYICLRFSIIWGFAIVLVVKIAHPFLTRSVQHFIPRPVGWWIMAFSYLAYFIDLIISVMVMCQINQELKELEEIRSNMRRFSNSISMLVGESTFLAQDMMNTIRPAMAEAQVSSSANSSQDSLGDKKIKNQLETRAEFEHKKELAEEKYREQMQSTRESFAQKAELAKDRASAVKEKASVAKDKANAAKGLATEKAEQTLAQLIQRKDAWFQSFHKRSHFTLRRILKSPRFRHLRYDEALREIQQEVDKTKLEGEG